MNKRPLSISIIGWIFIAVGVVALTYHSIHKSEDYLIWVLLVRFLAIVCGIAMLFRQNWGRWLAAAWLAFHVYLSIHHETAELIIHALLLVVMVYFMFRSQANAYFQAGNAPPASSSPDGNK